ncbi:MAG: YARHG domain-containing protein [Ignavibacteria bacterium]|nr:YARHG domain-containing protein [Ignavibacteria bacterium]
MYRISSLLVVLFASCLSLYAQGMYEFTSERLLDVQDLEGYSAQELLLMRNEIFARHGFIFQSSDLREHFENQSWYSGTSRDVSASLTSIEKKNIEMIKFIERKLNRSPSK